MIIKGDNIVSPNHYMQGNKETIDVIKDVVGKGYEGYLIGNIVKYISRYKYKNGIEDIKKARAYINFLIKELEVKEIER